MWREKVLAVSSLDKQILFWDLEKLIPVQGIDLKTISAHTLAYSPDYRVCRA